MSARRLSRGSLHAGIGAAVAIVAVLWVTLWALHPSLLVANTTDTGGDTGAHVALAWYLRQYLLPHGHLTGWYPGWFDGFPAFTYYFVLSDLIAALASHVIAFNVAFKITTVLGSLLLPFCAYVLGRLFRLTAPIPAFLAAATLPFLFEQSFTIDGGNLFSTMAGEYAFSLGLALSLVAIGLFARGQRSGRGVVLAAVVLSLTLAAHLLPWLFALAGIGVLVVVDALPARWRVADRWPASRPAGGRRALLFAVRAGLLSAALSAWWLVPWITSQQYTSSMGYVNVQNSHLFPGGDRVMLAIALIGVAVAFSKRSRFGIWLSALATVAGIAFVLDPQGPLFNERLLPFWFLCGWLLCGYVLGEGCSWATSKLTRWRRRMALVAAHRHGRGSRALARRRAVAPGALLGGVLAGALSVLVVVPPMTVSSTLLSDIGITVGPNSVPNWTAYNYTGYQGVHGWPYEKDWAEYHGVISMMRWAGARYGCGQSMWEYGPHEGDFGTPEALMLLPMWTGNCIGSMEGLLFESSATTPYHFINQAELSVKPSDPMNGIPYPPYGQTNVPLGLRHLQMLGVKYFLAFSPKVVAETRANPMAVEVGRSGPWIYDGQRTTWHLFIVKDAPRVSALDVLPNVVQGLNGHAWQLVNQQWWVTPSRLGVPYASSGPSNWPRSTSAKGCPIGGCVHVVHVRPVRVSDVHESLSSISFDVNRTGAPVLVHTSYFPRWHVTGASGPFRVSPNLMVVVPTSEHVVLDYEGTPANTAGVALTLLGIAIAIVALIWAPIRRRIPARS